MEFGGLTAPCDFLRRFLNLKFVRRESLGVGTSLALVVLDRLTALRDLLDAGERVLIGPHEIRRHIKLLLACHLFNKLYL